MSTREANIELLSVIPDSEQEKIYMYLSDFCNNNPFKPLSSDEICKELEASRDCYDNGVYEDFDNAVNEIGVKYGL